MAGCPCSDGHESVIAFNAGHSNARFSDGGFPGHGKTVRRKSGNTETRELMRRLLRSAGWDGRVVNTGVQCKPHRVVKAETEGDLVIISNEDSRQGGGHGSLRATRLGGHSLTRKEVPETPQKPGIWVANGGGSMERRLLGARLGDLETLVEETKCDGVMLVAGLTMF